MTEHWRAIPGWEGHYEVSDQGRVRSLDRLVRHGRGDAMRHRKGQLLQPGRKASGHLSVVLGSSGSHDVHVLVLLAFVGPRPTGQEARHADDDPGNNRLCNLSWGTRSQNMYDAVRNGRRGGERAWNAKLDRVKVLRIRTGGERPCDLARAFGVSESSIRQARDGRSWKGV